MTRFSTGRARLLPHLTGLSVAGLLLLGGAQSGPIRTLAAVATPATSSGIPVIAEADVRMPDNAIAWTVSAVAAAAQPAEVLTSGDPGFLIATEGTTLVRGGDKDEIRLKKGEGLAAKPEDQLTVQTAGAAPARLALMTLGQAEDGDQDGAGKTGEVFQSPEGTREVDLLRDDVKEGESAEIDAGEAPTFVLVTGGSIEIETKDGEPKTLKAGETALVDGEFTVTGAKKASSSFVAIVIGDEVEGDAEVAGPTPTSKGQSGQRPTPPPSNPTPVPPTPTPDGNGPEDDPDNDGLKNREEEQYGSDPRNPDTDADLLKDGEEVFTYGSSPTNRDNDMDGLYDGDEVIRAGTDPTFADTEGDGLNDFQEVNEYLTNPLDSDTDHDDLADLLEIENGTNSHVQDTDGDRIADGQEVLQYRTHPLVYDSDGDGAGDGDEVYTYGTDPNNPDSDGDGLSDSEERFLGTDARNFDTDGDGYGDGAEVYEHRTWPTDPTSHP